MSSKAKCFIAGLSLVGIVSGCGVPLQLIDARRAFTVSSNGLAGILAPTELRDAKKVLDQASQEFEAHGKTLSLLDFVYITQRKIELADVLARAEVDRQQIADAMKRGEVAHEEQVARPTETDGVR